MKQKTLALWLKIAIVALALIGLAVYAWIIPDMGLTMREAYPEFANRFYPWLIFLTATAIPCYAILVLGWLIARNIGLDRSFSLANARHLRSVAIASGVVSLYFFIGNNVLLFLDMSHPGIVLGSLLFVLAGFALTVASAALSHMVTKAAALQEENDLTV